MITEQQRQALLAQLNGPEFDDIKAKPDPDQALIKAIQQQTKVIRVLAAATLYSIQTTPPNPTPPQPKHMGQGIKRKGPL